ncbi:ankyrin repeat domain-containing protein [bacterium]|nr:ankyrin repeat domain-containing protein [bacterium]
MSDQENLGVKLHWGKDQIAFAVVKHNQTLLQTPQLQAYGQAVHLCQEGDWEGGLSLYEQVLSNLTQDELLLAQLACWGRSSALQQLDRHEESWEGLSTLFGPGRHWVTPLPLLLNWLQTAIVVAAHCQQSQISGMLLKLWHALSQAHPDWGLQQRFEELLTEAYSIQAEQDQEAAVDWLDALLQGWENEPAVRRLLVDGLCDLLEFEEALEEAEALQELEDGEYWAERIQDLREQAVDPYNLARRGDRAGLKALGKVNQLGKSGRNALMGAVVANDLELAEWLLERNANPNLIASDGWTPLLLAADHDFVEMAALLLRWKAELGATNEFDQTGLHVAAWQNHLEMAQFLLERGIEVGYGDEDGNTALHLAAGEPVPEMLKLLAPVIGVNTPNEGTGATALMVAAEADLVENLEVLLGLGADPNLKDSEGRRALDYAKVAEAKEAARFLKKL